MTLRTVSFEGHECLRLDGDGSAVMVTTAAGPRVLGLVGRGGNLLAVLPDAGLERPGGESFSFIGGHRLWVAPEVPEVTYEPDGRACAVDEVDGGARVEAPPDGAGLIKAIEVRSSTNGWIVDHIIRNASDLEMTIAPWAITQLKLSGEVHLPLGARGTGHQADRTLVLWPYTNLDDPRLKFERDAVLIRAEPGESPLKLGAAPSDAWVSYTTGDEVFEKRIRLDASGTYSDRGAAVQVYLCDGFCELETVGPLRALRPGGRLEHRERWTLRRRGGAAG